MTAQAFPRWKWLVVFVLGFAWWQIVKNSEFITFQLTSALGILAQIAPWFAIPMSILALVLALIGFGLLYRWPGGGLATLGLSSENLKRNILIGLGAAAAHSAVVLLIIIPVFDEYSKGVLASVAALFASTPALISAIFLLLLYGGVVEELFFRGHIITSISSAFQWHRLAVVISAILSAVLFGIAHGYQGTFGMVFSIASGLFWAFLYIRTKSLVTVIVAHGTYDLMTFAGIALFYRDFLPAS